MNMTMANDIKNRLWDIEDEISQAEYEGRYDEARWLEYEARELEAELDYLMNEYEY